MRVVFMGTPAFALPTLEALLRHHQVLAVCTQPDRPAGRGKQLQIGPVKEMALAAGVPIWQPHTLTLQSPQKAPTEPAAHAQWQARRDEALATRQQLAALQADCFVVAAYGLILPQAVLSMPRLGCINVHGSLLPAYRGAAPIQAALLNGDPTTGITIMHMDTGIDTGDMILKRTLEIGADEHFPSLLTRMAQLGAECLLEALPAIENNTAPREKQNEAAATYAPMLTRADGQLNWALPATTLANRVRALDPWPVAHTLCHGQPLKIWQATPHPNAPTQEPAAPPPGTVLTANHAGLWVQTGHGVLCLHQVQGPNSKRMPTADYLRGRNIPPGTVLG